MNVLLTKHYSDHREEKTRKSDIINIISVGKMN